MFGSRTPRCPGPGRIAATNRRDFLRCAGAGFGALALSVLEANQAKAGDSTNPLSAKTPHFKAKAKRCIFLFMVGGPSHVDIFDPKPVLNNLDGKPLPESFGKIHSQFLETDPICLGSRRKWGKYGDSGIDMSDLVPSMHRHADDIAVIRSCVADSVIHGARALSDEHGPGFHGTSEPGKLVDIRPWLGK